MAATTLRNLVRDCLTKVLEGELRGGDATVGGEMVLNPAGGATAVGGGEEKEQDFEGLVEEKQGDEKELGGGGEDEEKKDEKEDQKSLLKAVANTHHGMSGAKEGVAKCWLDTGLLKSGIRTTHQELHVDNPAVLENKTVHKIWKGESLSADDYLKLGYVVDLPLSQEGLWLRVAVPDPKKMVFVLHWVYVPFGCMLIRHISVWHSGHYGSPGNSRLHGTFSVEGGEKVKADSLGYLRKLAKDANSDFAGWKLEWHSTITTDKEKGRNGFRLGGKKNKGWLARGTKYYHDWILPLGNELWTNSLISLSPYTMLSQWLDRIGYMRQTDKKLQENRGDAEEAKGKDNIVEGGVEDAETKPAALDALVNESMANI
jgi:hypothetical protein